MQTTSLIDEDARRQFEALWRQGQPRSIEDFLPPPDHAGYLSTLEELVHIDLEFAWKLKKPSPPSLVEAYLARFPRLDQPAILLRLIDQEYQVRCRYGDCPSSMEYVARFPGVATKPEIFGTIWQDSETAATAAWHSGLRLGRYQLGVEHGRGGVGLVWRASDLSLCREVALKQLQQRVGDDTRARDRFVAEARIAAQLEHPGIVPVYDLGGLEDNQPYYAMKLVRGRTLTEEIRRCHERPKQTGERAVEELRLLNAFLSVTRALAYAHSCGVIHRDLKPDNIILGDYGETIVLDWGLAKIRGQNAVPNPSGAATQPVHQLEATQEGALLGTPAYMAPEQAAGRTGEVDERTDIYALGAILYQLLTGRQPFPAKNLAQLLDDVVRAQPAAPRSLNPSVPKLLEAICLRALAKRPGDRYAAVAALSGDLERFLADEPVSSYREPPWQRLARWGRRHRTFVISAVTTLAAAPPPGSRTHAGQRRPPARAGRQGVRREAAWHRREREKTRGSEGGGG